MCISVGWMSLDDLGDRTEKGLIARYIDSKADTCHGLSKVHCRYKI